MEKRVKKERWRVKRRECEKVDWKNLGECLFFKALQEVRAPAPELRWSDENGLA